MPVRKGPSLKKPWSMATSKHLPEVALNNLFNLKSFKMKLSTIKSKVKSLQAIVVYQFQSLFLKSILLLIFLVAAFAGQLEVKKLIL